MFDNSVVCIVVWPCLVFDYCLFNFVYSCVYCWFVCGLIAACLLFGVLFVAGVYRLLFGLQVVLFVCLGFVRFYLACGC